LNPNGGGSPGGNGEQRPVGIVVCDNLPLCFQPELHIVARRPATLFPNLVGEPGRLLAIRLLLI
jgi:hypothetical protein